MKIIISVILAILIVVVCFLWLLFLGSSHNVPSETHLTFAVLIIALIAILFVVRKSK